MSLTLPVLLLDRYLLTDEIGRGGHAVVYRARDQLLGRNVAIKVLREDHLGGEILARFQQEVQITSRLEHAHILHVYDTGTFAGRPFVVMELAPGDTLATRLSAEGQLPMDEALSLVRDIGLALAHAHERNVVHRDVKPENILLGPGGAILADFGVARLTQADLRDTLTSTGTAVGTLLYMSPEQLCADPDIDARSDQYSLACVLYEMLAGVRPHHAATFEGLRILRMSGTYTSVCSHRPLVSPAVDHAIQKALAAMPADRFRRMEDFLASLSTAPTADFSVSQTRYAVLPPATVGVDATLPPPEPTTDVNTAGSGKKRRKRRMWTAAALVGCVLAASAKAASVYYTPVPTADSQHQWSLPRDGSALRVAIEPAAVRTSLNDIGQRFGRAFAEEAASWQGVQVVESVSRRDAYGFTLIPEIVDAGDSLRIRIALTDAAGRTVGSIEHMMLRTVRRFEAATLTRLMAAAFMLRADTAGNRVTRLAPGAAEIPVRNLEAVRLYAAAFKSLWLGALPAARTLFDSAALTSGSGSFRYANFWSAQTGAWQSARNTDVWTAAAARSQVGPFVNAQDSLAVLALAAMSRRDYTAAAAAWSRVLDSDRNSFLAAYGLGQALELDGTIVRTGSGLAYRASAQRALDAYASSISIAPAPGLLGALFERIMNATYVRGSQLRFGTLDSVLYSSMPGLDADTLAFYPVVDKSRTSVMPESWSRAVTKGAYWANGLAEQFKSRWPRSPHAWYWRAVALELSGKLSSARGEISAPVALDSAAAFADNTELLMKIERQRVAVALRTGDVIAAIRMIRTTLDSARVPSAEVRETLLPLAEFIGDFAQVTRLQAMSGYLQSEIAASIVDSVEAFRLRVEMGVCDGLEKRRIALEELFKANLSAQDIEEKRASLLSMPYRLAAPCLGSAVAALYPATTAQDRALRLLAQGDNVGAAATIKQVDAGRGGGVPAATTWDFTYLESWILAAAGDTASARARLNRALNGIERMSYYTVTEPAQAAGLRNGILLLARIAREHAPTSSEQKWIDVAQVLR